MSDRFRPISMEDLTGWVFDELEQHDSIFGIPRELFFTPQPADPFRLEVYGQPLETPFGVAAGPHTQMAQNIVVAWLCGARFIELKTVQTLDELDVNKPCIDMQDEGYNVEWSQELKVFESFDEYLRAWVLIHALHRRLGFPGERPGMIFNMSVGYNLEGMLKPNVQWFFDTMDDASAYLGRCIDIVAERCPEVREVEIPARLSDNITLSTMHGCPPDEIESIVTYLVEERGLHTSVKCNPTLLGPDRVRGVLGDLGFDDVPVPDEAFGHDLKWDDAVPMFHNLRRLARRRGVTFGVKLTNTLEVENWRTVFADDQMMYLSGRALHPVTTNLALRLSEEFRGGLLLSFAGGADAFNAPDLLRSGMTTVTMCSDLLKSGGYLRLLQYLENTAAAMEAAGAAGLEEFAARSAVASEEFAEFAPVLHRALLADSGLDLDPEACGALAAHLAVAAIPVAEAVAGWAAGRGMDAGRIEALSGVVQRVLARLNLRGYAAATRRDRRYHKHTYETAHSKTDRTLGLFDCIEAPCVDECPVDQNVPEYMRRVRDGDLTGAVAITRADNPIPAILGHVCDHLCEHTCIRTHYDEPLAIREMKRFIMDQEGAAEPPERPAAEPLKVAVIGAGPCGISAAAELAASGCEVRVLERHPYPGGMVGGAIPTYRLPQERIDRDVSVLDRLGVDVRYGVEAGRDVTLAGLRAEGFERIVVAVGAQLAKRLGLEGEEAEGVLDGIAFLRSVREGDPIPIGERVAVVGAGDTAMDCARSAWRLGSKVAVVYRRTIDQMPADREEVRALLDEGIEVIDLALPVALHVEDGRLAGLLCRRMEYRGDRDAGGRKIPHEVEGSEFEVPFDTMLLAISQHSVLDFFGDEMPAVTPKGYLATDPETLETSIPGVYAGGDVGTHGPASIVKAAGDGKRIAAAILARSKPRPTEGHVMPADRAGLLRRRARREYRVPIREIPVADRRNFAETTYTYSLAEARAEASRCLDCDLICSICVGVCPNLAILTYESSPAVAAVPVVEVSGGEARIVGTEEFHVDQHLQVAVLTDFCNECGNCATFCPTAGRPYVDKPRLYLDRDDFEAQPGNAFMLLGNGGIAARYGGETHRISLNGDLAYESPALRARLDPATFDVVDLETGDAEGTVSLRPAAEMLALLNGLAGSAAHLPTVGAEPGTRIGHPGYAEGT
jgi:putative selenate reductase